MTVSQVATGKENGFTIRSRAEKGDILWEHENPNYEHLSLQRAAPSHQQGPQGIPVGISRPGAGAFPRGIPKATWRHLPKSIAVSWRLSDGTSTASP